MAGGLWIALVAGGLIAGLGVVGALALPVGREPVGGIASFLGFLMSLWALGRLASVYDNPQTPVVALCLAAAALAGGYGLASVMLPQVARQEIPRPIPAPPSHRTALLLLSEAEPEPYDPAATALELVELQEDDVLNLGIVTTPFLFTAQKARYRAVGGLSPARRQIREIAEAHERSLEGLGFEHFGVAWCSGRGSLLEQIEDLARAGYSRIVVQPLAVGEPLEMQRAKMLVDRGRPDEAGVAIAYAAPLHSADAIAALLARRIVLGVDDPTTTGVALLAHGQPETREQLHPGFDADEASFVNRIKMLVAETGVPNQNIRLAWAEWRDPDVTSTVRHLAALGCTRILVCPACYAVDCIATLIDIPMAIRQARIDPLVSVVTLSTWRDESEVVAVLRDRTLDALRELDAPVAAGI